MPDRGGAVRAGAGAEALALPDPPRGGGSGCEVWLDGRRSVTIAIALTWSGALDESVGAWFGVRWCGHRTGAARWRHHGSPPSRRARAATRVARGVTAGALTPGPTLPEVRGVFDVSLTSKPTRIPERRGPSAGWACLATYGRGRQAHLFVVCCVLADVGLLNDPSPRQQAHPPRPRGRRANAKHNQPRLAPLGADRPRWHADSRLSGTPRQTRHEGVRITRTRSPISALRRQTWAVRYPSQQQAKRTPRVVGAVDQQQHCDRQ